MTIKTINGKPNLRGAQKRKRKETGKKVGGRKSDAELAVVAEARRVRSAKGKTGRLSYREISARLKVPNT